MNLLPKVVLDPSYAQWVSSFDVTFIQTKPVIPDYQLKISYKLTAGNPGGTIAIKTYTAMNSDTSETVLSEPLGAAGETQSITTAVSIPSLELIWSIEVTFPGKDPYVRKIYFSRAKVTPTSKDEMVPNPFPEQDLEAYSGRTDTAVCFSGGGTRALLLAMGQLRYLDTKGFLKNTGYMSCVSGGSWAATMYTYAPVKDANMAKLYGEVVPMSGYSAQMKETSVPNMAVGTKSKLFLGLGLFGIVRVAANWHLDNLIDNEKDASFWSNLLDNVENAVATTPERFWIDLVGCSFFAWNSIYNIFEDRKSTFTLDNESREAVEGNGGSQSLFLKSNSAFNRTVNIRDGVYPPYLVINSLMLRPEDNPPLVPGQQPPYIGYEYTPLYHGAAYNGAWSSGVPVDGGLAQMYTYGAKGAAVQGPNTMLTMHESNVPMPSLAVASGTSSSAHAGIVSTGVLPTGLTIVGLIAALISELKENGTDDLVPEITKAIGDLKLSETEAELGSKMGDLVGKMAGGASSILSLLEKLHSAYQERNQFTKKLSALAPQANYFNPGATLAPLNNLIDYGDAGLSDNFGLMAMLRRKVNKIVVFVNSETKFVPPTVPNGSDYTIDATLEAFFKPVSDPTWNLEGIRLEGLQVFPESVLNALISGFKVCKTGNRPLIVETPNLQVSESKQWGVDPYRVNILWVYNDATAWVHNLKTTGQSQVVTDLGADSGKKYAFPHLNTLVCTIGGVSSPTANMMGNLAYWNLDQPVSPSVSSFLGG